MKILLTLFFLFNINFIFSHTEGQRHIEFEKHFISSMGQEAHILALDLSPSSIQLTKDFFGKPTNQTLLKLKQPSKRDKYVLRLLDNNSNELLTLGIGNPFYAYAHHIGFEDRKVMGGPVSSAKIEIAIPINLDAKFIAISSRDSKSNLKDIQKIKLP
tara:strand:- start:6 stop:479 length:474 start_codon:yes stop_codon:yes gene_type:complete